MLKVLIFVVFNYKTHSNKWYTKTRTVHHCFRVCLFIRVKQNLCRHMLNLEITKAFNSQYRYKDDVLSVNNPIIGDNVDA